MLLRSLLALAVLSLSSCKPKTPDIDFCGLIFDESLEKSFGYCLSWLPESAREYDKPAQELFQESYVCVSTPHYADLINYVNGLNRKGFSVPSLPSPRLLHDDGMQHIALEGLEQNKTNAL